MAIITSLSVMAMLEEKVDAAQDSYEKLCASSTLLVETEQKVAKTGEDLRASAARLTDSLVDWGKQLLAADAHVPDEIELLLRLLRPSGVSQPSRELPP